MNRAVILHGKPTQERYENPDIPKPHKANWFPWIKAELFKVGIEASVPALPEPYHPNYESWKKVFEGEKVDSDTGLVAHSASVEFLLRWLAANKTVTLERAVLVAPYRDYAGKYGDFSNYKLDKDIPKRIGNLTIINSLDDDEPIQRRTQELIEAFPTAKLVEVDGYGHFRIGHNMTGPEFPELLDELTTETDS
ncbi:MAG: alpha/beta hydrolase [Candidatus Saccharibacteria bacterium]|nr:alpha/beta hydrolase [Candidatus Saccharibacteria bacterium]